MRQASSTARPVACLRGNCASGRRSLPSPRGPGCDDRFGDVRSLSTTKPARSSQVAVATLGEGQACAGRNARQQRGSAREDGQSLAGQAVIVWRYAFDMGGDVAAFATDSGSSLRVTGRRESAARYKSLSFEFSAATAQGPTAGQQARAAPYRPLWRRGLRGGVPRFVK